MVHKILNQKQLKNCEFREHSFARLFFLIKNLWYLSLLVVSLKRRRFSKPIKSQEEDSGTVIDFKCICAPVVKSEIVLLFIKKAKTFNSVKKFKTKSLCSVLKRIGTIFSHSAYVKVPFLLI